MLSAGQNSKTYRDMSKSDIDALLKVCVKDLVDYKVAQRAAGAVKTRRQIARLLTRLRAL